MTARIPPPLSSEVISRFRGLVATGEAREAVIAEMRRADLHIVECIKLVRTIYDVSLGDAKEIVHCSKAWADVRKSNDRFHDDLIEAALQEGWTVDDPQRETVARVA